MAKVALLIGVSEYEPGLNPLPGALKDVEAMQRVLQDPEIGGFDEVKTLQNPEPLAMQEAVQTLFSERTRDDLVFLFFSGHGVKDDRGKLHFATRLTRKSQTGELMKATVVPARFVQEIMSDSRSKRQIVILDCCFSGAFAEDLSAKDDGTVDVKSQLGGGKEVEGRVVLTSSTSTQYSFEQKGSELSIYTRYLIEGIETGAADRGDGEIDVDELHEYARSKVQESAPAMRPKIFPSGESYKIVLAKAPTGDPKLKYRRQVEEICRRHKGEISSVGRDKLNTVRENLGLSFEETAAIEAGVLKPYQDYKQKLRRYEETLTTAIQGRKELNEDTINELKDYQQTLGLRSEDVEPVEIKVLGKPLKPKLPTPQSLVDGAKYLIARFKNRETGVNLYMLAGAGFVSVVALGFLANYSISRYRFEQFYNQGQTNLEKGEFEESKSSFTKALSIDQNSAKAYVGLGNAFLEEGNGDADEAISKFDKAIQLDPRLAEAYFGRGKTQQAKQKTKEALDDYAKAIEYDPNYAKAYLYRGVIYYRQDKNKEALDDSDKAIALKPEFIEAHVLKCEAFYELQKYDEAIKACGKAVEAKGIDEKDQKYRSYAYFTRANAYLDRGDSGDQDSASKDSEQFLNDEPGNSRAYLLSGRAYIAQQKPLKALEVFTNGINLLKTQDLDSEGSNLLAKFYVYRGNTRLQMQPPDFNSAADDYWYAIQADKNFSPAYEMMGDLLSKMNNGYYGGCQDKRTCMAINFYNSARDLYSEQNFPEAYQRVLSKIQQLP